MLGLTRRANVQRLFEVAYRFHLDCYAALGQNPGADLIRTPHRRSSGDKGPRLARKLHNKDGCVAQLCNLEAMLGEPLGKQPGPTMPIYINVFPPEWPGLVMPSVCPSGLNSDAGVLVSEPFLCLGFRVCLPWSEADRLCLVNLQVFH